MTHLDDLHRQYRQSLAGKGDDLRRAWDALCDEEVEEAQVKHVHLLLHRLAGSAGTYGYADIAARAKALERVWTEWLGQTRELRPEAYRVCASQACGMGDLLDALRTAVQVPGESPSRA